MILTLHNQNRFVLPIPCASDTAGLKMVCGTLQEFTVTCNLSGVIQIYGYRVKVKVTNIIIKGTHWPLTSYKN